MVRRIRGRNEVLIVDVVVRGENGSGCAQVELATAAWVHFWNTQRLHEARGYLPRAELEAVHQQRRVTNLAA